MEINVIGITGVASITLICFGIAFALKKTEKFPSKFIPLFCMGLGAILGLVAFFLVPAFPAGDWLTAIAMGIASGWAATGAHQSVKQLWEGREQKEAADDGDKD